MKSQMMIAAALIALGAPALACAQTARADSDARQVSVSFADLNLATNAGQATLKTRLDHAARTACGERPDNRDLRALAAYQACVKTSVQTATASVLAPSMVAGNNGHNG